MGVGDRVDPIGMRNPEFQNSQEAPFTAEQSTSVQDRRRSNREERSASAWLSAASTSERGGGFNVNVRDLSLHGVGFISQRPLRPNDTHWMIVTDASLRLSTRVRIVSCRENDEGQFEVGGEFF